MADLREVELRIAVAEGVMSRSEADALGDEARRKQQSPLALLVERGRISDESYQSFFAAALNDPAWRAAGHDAAGSTYTMLAPPAPPSDEPAFPVAGWDRYVNVRFLGQGGMGKVFLAVDARLRREVAIKFVRGDDAEHVRRLIAEARTQAKVSHERICRVYEVGEVDGKVYIAMQYIHGAPLGQLSGELTLEQKVMLVRGAAEGIHDAHRVGIIHRDIKPSNIMVERTDDGDIRPYVMDFGLARSVQEAGTTQAGAVLGTPRYMAPEQAEGDPAKLDRRADVYSLGATLYHLVTGFPPVDGATITEVIHNLMVSEPRPLRERDPGIPADLEAIVLKCLERDRSARYDSARALADDLGRFLDGEPVLARPVGAWYRLRRRLAKHRRLVAAGAVVVAALAVAIGWAIATSREASERERLAREFTEHVERIEATARYSALAPRHDVRDDRKALRAQMAALEHEIRDAGDVAAGPGHYALGRGYLALGDDDQARAELDAAWRDGFTEPRAAYALALALGHLYQRGLLAAERFEDRAMREARKHEAEQRYRDPARNYLARAEGAEVPSPDYVAALRAFYDGKLDPALHHLDALRGGAAWFYEARQLRGEVLFARAAGFRDRGDTGSARADLEAAREAYGEAAEIARSAPAVYASLADLEYAAMVMELYVGGDVGPLFDRALAATGHALELFPDYYEALVLQSRFRRSLAERKASKGVDVTDLLTSALRDAEHAIAIQPARVEARLAMAKVHRQWGTVLVDHNDDPSEHFGKVLAISDAIAPADRDSEYYGNLGLTFSAWAQDLDQRGESGAARREQAIAAYHSALRYGDILHGQGEFAVWLNLGIDLRLRASQPRAPDPDGDLQRASDAFHRAKLAFPGSYVPSFYEGQVHDALAQRIRARGGDPGPELERALEAYEAGLKIQPGVPHLHNGLGGVRLAQARAAWDRGGDPGPRLDEAQAAFQRAIETAPEQQHGYDNVGETLVQRAWFQRASDADPTASVAAAVTMLNRAIKIVPKDATYRANLGMAHALLAAYDLEHGRDPQPSLDAAAAALGEAQRLNPKDPLAQLYRGEILGIRAGRQAQLGSGKPDDFAQAARAFETAIELDPEDQDHQLVFDQFYRAWASAPGGDPSTPIERGLALASQLLDRRPDWPDARILQASLMLAKAQRTVDAGEQRKLARSAADDFARALKTNPVLGKLWARQLAQAQQLATR